VIENRVVVTPLDGDWSNSFPHARSRQRWTRQTRAVTRFSASRKMPSPKYYYPSAIVCSSRNFGALDEFVQSVVPHFTQVDKMIRRRESTRLSHTHDAQNLPDVDLSVGRKHCPRGVMGRETP
jgi:hypothetical protein